MRDACNAQARSLWQTQGRVSETSRVAVIGGDQSAQVATGEMQRGEHGSCHVPRLAPAVTSHACLCLQHPARTLRRQRSTTAIAGRGPAGASGAVLPARLEPVRIGSRREASSRAISVSRAAREASARDSSQKDALASIARSTAHAKCTSCSKCTTWPSYFAQGLCSIHLQVTQMAVAQCTCAPHVQTHAQLQRLLICVCVTSDVCVTPKGGDPRSN
jgi:hypothetical protein